MSNAERIYELVKTMPEAQSREVLDFAEFLQQKASAKAEEHKLTEDRSVPSQLVSLPTFSGYIPQGRKENITNQDEVLGPETAVGAQALEILQRNGFVGCLHEEDDLSVRYKEELVEDDLDLREAEERMADSTQERVGFDEFFAELEASCE